LRHRVSGSSRASGALPRHGTGTQAPDQPDGDLLEPDRHRRERTIAPLAAGGALELHRDLLLMLLVARLCLCRPEGRRPDPEPSAYRPLPTDVGRAADADRQGYRLSQQVRGQGRRRARVAAPPGTEAARLGADALLVRKGGEIRPL